MPNISISHPERSQPIHSHQLMAGNTRNTKVMQVINKQTEQVSQVVLKKQTFFSFLEKGIARLTGKKIIQLKTQNEDGKTVTYLAKLHHISQASGIAPKDLRESHSKGELGQFIEKHNLETLTDKVSTTFTDEFKSHLQESIEKASQFNAGTTYNLVKLLSKETSFEKINNVLKVIVDNQGKQELSLKNLKEKYSVNDADMQKIEMLSKTVNPEHLEIFLQLIEPEMVPKLIKTFCAAADKIKNNSAKKDIYVKKSLETYSFGISRTGELTVGLGYLASGTFKKVSKAVNVTSMDGVVKIVQKGDREVKLALDEAALQEKLYTSNNPYILKPNKFTVMTKTGGIHKPPELRENKYVEFGKRLDGDGTSIKPDQVEEIAQFLHDYAKGLEYMHQSGYIHSDVKPANALRRGKRAVVSDFGLSVKKDSSLIGGTPLYFPNEVGPFYKIAKPSFDSYSLGVSLLSMLYGEEAFQGELKKINTHFEKLAQLRDDEREELFTNLKQLTQKNESALPVKFVEMKVKMLDLAIEMTAREPDSRPTCGQMAERLAQIVPSVITSDPSQ